jgi:hypothetical protein
MLETPGKSNMKVNPSRALATLLLLSTVTRGAVLYVAVNSTNPVAPYPDWSTAATNIQDAIDVSTGGDEIVVTNGFYSGGTKTIYSYRNRVALTKPVTVRSVNGPTNTVIWGTDSGAIRCAYLTNNATLAGFTLTNGFAAAGSTSTTFAGGGVWCEDSTATVSNCIIVGNTAGIGGGAFHGTLTNCLLAGNVAYGMGGGAASNVLNGCTIVSNTAQNPGFGGGGACASTLNGCSLVGNQAVGGGGAVFSRLYNCTIIGNSAVNDGGGADYSILVSCLISTNVAQVGGGLAACDAGSCTICFNRANSQGGGASGGYFDGGGLTNCLVVSNTAAYQGGGTEVNLFNCTVVGNWATNRGGGTYDGVLVNSLIYGNFAPSESNFTQTHGSLSYCCTWPLPTNGVRNFTNSPALVNLPGGDFHLASNSPCINAGNNAYAPGTTDLDGNPRIVGGTVDIGAYEFQTPASVISYAWLQQFGLPTDGSADFIDTDGDGMNNWQEWRCGTDPTNPLSVLKMLSPSNSLPGVTVSWASVSGVDYYLQRSTNLSAQPAFLTIQSNILGQTGTTTFTDTNAPGPGPLFYRVGVQ